ncbi:hypothetical protein QUB05_00075 [Microcoleus sp. F10-C6]|uniref:hypothetical protein n=1 Tax=unclassified Microcoleus TaxID=2642155 RepID=UPI002FD2CB5C
MKNPGKIIIINIAVTLLFIVFLNFLSEGVLLIYGLAEQQRIMVDERANLPNYADDRETAKLHFQEFNQLSTQFEPFVGWSRKPFHGETININAKGDRIHKNETTSEAISPDVTSIDFFGGSTMWGTGVVDTETIPALFNNISKIPTFNRAETNFTSRQSLERLINLLTVEAETINSVVFYDGVNDILNLCRSENQVGEHGYTDYIRKLLESNGNKSPENDFWKYIDFTFLRGTRSLIKLVRGEIINHSVKTDDYWDRTMNCDNQPQKAQQIASALIKNWEIAHVIAQAQGINFLGILQPVAFMENPKLAQDLHLNVGWNNELRKQYKTVYPLIQSMMRERGYDFLLDYTDLLNRDRDIYIDFCHLSKNGNMIIAEQLYRDFMRK